MQTVILHKFLKSSSLLLLLVAFTTAAFCQTVEISTNASTSVNIVTGNLGYHVGENLYFTSELGTNFTTAASAINRIEFSVNAAGAPPTFNNYNVYLKEVPSTTTSFVNGTYSTAGYTLVYAGSINISAAEWIGVNLATPFARTPGNNLQLLLERLDGISRTSSFTYNASVGNGTTGSTAATTRRYNGNTAPVAGTTAYTLSAFRPAARFIHLPPTDAGLTDLSLPASSCYTAQQSVSVKVNNTGLSTIIGAGAATVSLSITGINTYTATAANTAIIPIGGSEVVTFSGIPWQCWAPMHLRLS